MVKPYCYPIESIFVLVFAVRESLTSLVPILKAGSCWYGISARSASLCWSGGTILVEAESVQSAARPPWVVRALLEIVSREVV